MALNLSACILDTLTHNMASPQYNDIHLTCSHEPTMAVSLYKHSVISRSLKICIGTVRQKKIGLLLQIIKLAKLLHKTKVRVRPISQPVCKPS